jgi:glycosyltransferase involved in cell wall biosynthesis
MGAHGWNPNCIQRFLNPPLNWSLSSHFKAVIGEDWQMSWGTERPIRVMRVIARMNVGGPAVQVSGLMRGLNSSEFDHRLYTGFCAVNEADYLDSVATDVKAIRINGLGRRISVGGDVKAFVSLIKAIREFKPNIIHTHTAKAGFLGRIASLVSLQKSIRVHTFHGHLLNGYFDSFKRLLIVIAERALATITQQLLAVGDKVREDLLKAGIGKKEKFGLMPPGLEIGSLSLKAKSKEFYALNSDRLQCAYIGRVTQIKRPDLFLDVVSEIKKREINLDFFIAGDGELLETCRKRISAEELPVSVLGWQTNIERVLSAADIVVLTSDNEGTPLSLIQAGMAGLPVVTTNVGSVPEVVLNNVTGIITELDVQQIADALEALSSNSGLCAQLGKAAQEFTLANFGVQRLVKDHEELYKKLLANQAKL